jgi:adenylyltransferase/sulfurtransferase
VWGNRFTRIGLESLDRSNCPACARGRFEFLDEPAQHATTLCGRGAVQVTSSRPVRLDLAALAERLGAAGEVVRNEYLVRFRTGDVEMTIFPDARSIIKGVSDPAAARSLYSRYIGA